MVFILKKMYLISKTVKFVPLPLLLLKLLAVEHAYHTKNATLRNTIALSLTQNSSIEDL